MYQYEFELDEEAYISCYHAYIEQSQVGKRLIAVCRVLIPIVILSAGYGMTNKYENLFGIILFGALALGWGIMFPKSYMRSMKRVSRRMLKENNDQTLYARRLVTIGENQITEEIIDHGIMKKWNRIANVMENEKHLFLYVTSQEAVILPKEAIGDIGQIEALKHDIESNNSN